MTTPRLMLDYAASLDPDATEHPEPRPRSWFITHGFGKPAAGTYTEVAVPLLTDDAGEELPEHAIDALVRLIAADLYGTAWAFHYRPAEYADAIERWGLRLRERVIVHSAEVYQ